MGVVLAMTAATPAEAAFGSVGRPIDTCIRPAAPGLDPARRKILSEFASQERRHLGLENAVILPIARLRLDADDLATLGRRLAARRGRVLSEPGA